MRRIRQTWILLAGLTVLIGAWCYVSLFMTASMTPLPLGQGFSTTLMGGSAMLFILAVKLEVLFLAILAGVLAGIGAVMIFSLIGGSSIGWPLILACVAGSVGLGLFFYDRVVCPVRHRR